MSNLPETPRTPPAETNGSIGGKLSSTAVRNISIIAVVGVIAIGLLLYGNFEGKISRVLSTLVLFGIFLLCSSYQMAKSKASEREPLLGQLGNLYMLLLSLVLIWGTLAVDNYTDIALLPLTLLIAGLVQLGIYLTQRVAAFISAPQKQLSSAAYLTSAGLTATTLLFTLPVGLNDLQSFGEGYWRFSIAVILFTGIMVIITGFIVWAFRSNNETAPAKQESNPPRYPAANQQPTQLAPVRPQTPVTPFSSPQLQNPVTATTPVRDEPVAEENPYVQQGVPQFAAPVAAAMPWPVFPNGQPIPAKSNGRPDFSALQTVADIYAESERQFFG